MKSAKQRLGTGTATRKSVAQDTTSGSVATAEVTVDSDEKEQLCEGLRAESCRGQERGGCAQPVGPSQPVERKAVGGEGRQRPDHVRAHGLGGDFGSVSSARGSPS